METILSKDYLIRGKRKFLIKKINKITIKRTTNNTIREIGIFLMTEKVCLLMDLVILKSLELIY
jgi:hypothetical protein